MNRAWNLLRNALDRATIYLPIILTAAVALGTYWLVRNAPKLLEPTAKAAPTHEPDFFCLLYTSPSPRDRTRSRMPSSA